MGIVRLVDTQALAAAEIIWSRPIWLWRELARGDATELATAVNLRSEELWRAGWRYLKPYRGSPFCLEPSLLDGVLRCYSEGGLDKDE